MKVMDKKTGKEIKEGDLINRVNVLPLRHAFKNVKRREFISVSKCGTNIFFKENCLDNEWNLIGYPFEFGLEVIRD